MVTIYQPLRRFVDWGEKKFYERNFNFILFDFLFFLSFQEEPKSGDGLLPNYDAQLINGVLTMFLRVFVRNLVV